MVVVLGGAEFVVTALTGGGFRVEPRGTAPDAEDAEKEIVDRWGEKGKNAVTLLEEYRAAGLAILAPSTRKEKLPEPEIRVVTKSVSGKYVAVYVNSETVRVNGKNMVPVVQHLPGAEVRRPHGDAVAFKLANLDQCRAAMQAMLAV